MSLPDCSDEAMRELDKMASDVDLGQPDSIPATVAVEDANAAGYSDDAHIKVGWSPNITGPMQKKSAALVISPEPQTVDGELFVRLNFRDDWLCRFLTGKGTYFRPCSQTKIVQMLGKAMETARADIIQQGMNDNVGATLGIAPSKSSSSTGKSTLKMNVHNKKNRETISKTKVIKVSVPRMPDSRDQVSISLLNNAKVLSMALTSQTMTWLCRVFRGLAQYAFGNHA